jgi:anti-anti-sigma factor
LANNDRGWNLFDLVVETRGGVAIMRPDGDLFLRESEIFEERVTELLRANYERFIVNLKGVNYIGSSGIGALINLYNQLTKMGGRMVITNLPDKVVEVLQIMGLEIIETMDTEKEAVKALSKVGG